MEPQKGDPNPNKAESKLRRHGGSQQEVLVVFFSCSIQPVDDSFFKMAKNVSVFGFIVTNFQKKFDFQNSSGKNPQIFLLALGVSFSNYMVLRIWRNFLKRRKFI